MPDFTRPAANVAAVKNGQPSRRSVTTGPAALALPDTPRYAFGQAFGVSGQVMPSNGLLPAGLDPVSAGRLGLWLLSRRSHRAAQKRIAFPARVWSSTYVCRFARLIAPWRCYEYPGAAVVLAGLCGISRGYANNLLKPSQKLPAVHAHRLANYLEAHAAECDALARELRVYADSGNLAKTNHRS